MTTIIQGDARAELARFPDGHFHCVVTSPPYWGLRDYGLEPLIWDGSPECEHEWGKWQEIHDEREAARVGKTRTTDRFYGDESRRFDGNHQKHTAGAFCRRCGAWKGSLGNEPTPDCGRPFMELRPGLSGAQLASAHQRLLDAGLLDGATCDTDGRESGHSQQGSGVRDMDPTAGDGEPATSRPVSGNLGMSNHLASEQRRGTLCIQESDNQIASPESDHPSNEDGPGRQGGDSEVDDAQVDGGPLKSLPDVRSSVADPSRTVRFSAFSRVDMPDRESLAFPGETPTASAERQAASRRSGSSSSRSHGKSSSRTKPPPPHRVGHTDCSCVSSAWAYYLLPPDILSICRPRLCGQCYVCHLVAVFREVRRVLRDDGCLFLNMGDSYNAAGRDGHGTRIGYKQGTNRASAAGADKNRPTAPSLKPKDLLLMPARVALALQADGWWLRAEIVWSKPNPIPESVMDRPTRSHEMVYLLTKSARYYYDADAVREQCESGPSDVKKMLESKERIGGIHKVATDPLLKASSLTNIGRKRAVGSPAGRNLRSVWTISTQPYSGAHFATFPEKLVERCILAGTSEWGCCPECGKPWVRVVKKATEPHPNRWSKEADAKQFSQDEGAYGEAGTLGVAHTSRTVGWRPGCTHDHKTVRCRTLDPFAGSGTVGAVAERLGRDSVLVELNPDYCELARHRTAQRGLTCAPQGASAPELAVESSEGEAP